MLVKKIEYTMLRVVRRCISSDAITANDDDYRAAQLLLEDVTAGVKNATDVKRLQ